jgi:hypothetical protein
MIKINNDMNNKDRRNDANRKPFSQRIFSYLLYISNIIQHTFR